MTNKNIRHPIIGAPVPSQALPDQPAYDINAHYQQICDLHANYPLNTEAACHDCVVGILTAAMQARNELFAPSLIPFFGAAIYLLYRNNDLFFPDAPSGGSRDRLTEMHFALANPDRIDQADRLVIPVFRKLFAQLPATAFIDPETVPTAPRVSLAELLPGTKQIVHDFCTLMQTPFTDRYKLFPATNRHISSNIIVASGYDPSTYTDKRLTYPSEHKGDGAAVAKAYLVNTSLALLLTDSIVPFPLTTFKNHHWAMFARTGHGKTQTLQSLILAHLQEPDPPAMIIIDSESNLKAGTGMLANIERLALFDSKLRDRLLVVDPRAETPPALNMFDVDDLDDEAETEAIDLYAYIFRALDQSLTGLQATTFAFVARLMIAHGNANLSTLLDFLSENVRSPSQSAFAAVIERLDPMTRRFFETQFYENRFARETRGTLANRLFGVLSSRAMQRMFDARANKVDLLQAMQQKKIVLIAPGGLGTQGTPLFARTMIALTLRAAYKRRSHVLGDPDPVLLFVDEAHGLFDEQLDTLLIRARKLGLFLRFATQHFDQIPDDMRAAIVSNTEVFLAGGLSYGDATKLARDMRTDAEFLMSTKVTPNVRTEFAVFIHNQTSTPIKLTFPFGMLEQQHQSDNDTFNARQRAVRQRLASPEDPTTQTEEKALPPSPSPDDPDSFKDSF